jgi:Transposase DDE domain group 1
MGERKREIKPNEAMGLEPMIVDTPGGRIHVKWEMQASATPSAQLAFFAEFLQTTGIWDAWIKSCPIRYTSPNACELVDVLGTWLLAILSGHKRYAHVTALRGDKVSAQLLGMSKIVSEDALRRALARMSHEQSSNWLFPHLLSSVRPALDTPWILDIDTTIKSLFGKQVGAEVGYNPHKPGRPSHALHTYWVGNLRLVLDVALTTGKEHSSRQAQPRLMQILDELTPQQRPALVRGDCGFGNDPFILKLEERGQPYLFKLKQTAGVKKLLARQFNRDDWSEVKLGDQGWSAIESTLKLTGWNKERRVVILRRPVKADIVLSRKTKAEGGSTQIELLHPDHSVRTWEHAVLVTNSAYELAAFGQLYRDRADAENGFDELKNQWGWGGFTTQDMERCQTSSRAVALIYNWWSWYCRAAKPDKRMEAITSRALLLAGVGKATQHANQTTIHLTPMHAARKSLIALINNVRAALAHVKATAEQLLNPDRWRLFLDYVVAQIAPKLAASNSQLVLKLMG